MIEGGSPAEWSSTGKEVTGDVGPRVVGKGMVFRLSHFASENLLKHFLDKQ